MVGAAIVAVIANLLNLLGVSPFSQQIVKGTRSEATEERIMHHATHDEAGPADD